jgi:hypothetical protein
MRGVADFAESLKNLSVKFGIKTEKHGITPQKRGITAEKKGITADNF